MGRRVVLCKVPSWLAGRGILQRTSRTSCGWRSNMDSGSREGPGTSRFYAHVAIINVESR